MACLSLVYWAAVIDLPDLHAGTMRKIDHSNASLWAAAHTKDFGLGMMDRQRVKVWTSQVYRQIDPVAAALFTPAPGAVVGATGESWRGPCKPSGGG